MKIGEAVNAYSARMQSLNAQKQALYEKRQALLDGKIELNDDEITALKKSIDRVELRCEKTSQSLNSLNERRTFLSDAENSRRQSEAAAKQAEEYSKCLEVARRISRGDKVPPKDEEKLLKFSAEMYQAAKNMGSLAQNDKVKKHKSLWKDEDENSAPEKSVEETVDDMEAGIDAANDISEFDF